jgi:hypothetical protein
MKSLRDALRAAGMVGALGSTVIFATIVLARCAEAQDTTRVMRGGYSLLLRSRPAPPALSIVVSLDSDSVPLSRALQDVARRARVGIVYDRSLPGLGDRVSIHDASVTAAGAILHLLDGRPVDALVAPNGQIVLVRHVTQAAQLHGLVLDSTGVPVPNALVELGPTPLVTVTAHDGAFAFSRVAPGDHELRVRRLGYHPATSAVHLVEGDVSVAPIVVTLEPTPVPLTAVVVSPGYFGIMGQQVAAQQTLDREAIRTRPQLGDDLLGTSDRLRPRDSSTGGHSHRRAGTDGRQRGKAPVSQITFRPSVSVRQ